MPRRGFGRTAFTLIEILVALAVTMLLMMAAVTLFATISRGIDKNVRDAETFQKLHHSQELLAADMAGMTAPRGQGGYTEIIEFSLLDGDNTGLNSHLGDYDEVLAFTTRSSDSNFTSIGGQMQLINPGSNLEGGGLGAGGTSGSGIIDGGGSNAAAAVDPLCQLDKDFGFNPTTPETFASDPGVKWVRATAGMYPPTDSTSGWYVITSAGVLKGWKSGTINGGNAVYGPNVANVGTGVYTTPALLYGAYTGTGGAPCPDVSTTTTGGTTIGTTTGAGATTTTTTTTTSTTGGPPSTPLTANVESRSRVAEVIWFVHKGVLYRRVLPILPGAVFQNVQSKDDFYTRYSVSAREASANVWIPNSLRDLEHRGYRHAHSLNAPHLFSQTDLVSNISNVNVDLLGTTAVLDHVVGFNVKVWDPGAPIVSVQSVSGGGAPGGTTTGGATTGTTSTTGTSTTTGASTTGTTSSTSTSTTTGGTTAGTTTTSSTSSTTGGTSSTTGTTTGTTTGGGDLLCQLDRSFGFNQASPDAYATDPGVKWVRATAGKYPPTDSTSGWYVITSTGVLKGWKSGTINGGNAVYGPDVANVGTGVYATPSLLYNGNAAPCSDGMGLVDGGGSNAAAAVDPLCQLDKDFFFNQASPDAYASDPGVKWVRATAGMYPPTDSTSGWYVITSTGVLKGWKSGTINGGNAVYGPNVANVGTGVYTTPALLYGAYTGTGGAPCPDVSTTTGGSSTTTGGTTTGATTGASTTSTTGGSSTTTTGGTTTGASATSTTTTGGTSAGTTTGTTGATTGGTGTTTGAPAIPTPGTRVTLLPGDPGYVQALLGNGNSKQIVGYGAYVDLPSRDGTGALRTYAPGYTPAAGAPVPRYNQVWNAHSQLPTAGNNVPGIYDSWTDGYKNELTDGLDNNNNGIVDDPSEDAGTDGLDNNANGTVDEAAESSGAPPAPYAGPLEGIQIKIRVYDPVSRSVREATVRQNFRQ